MLNLGPIDMNKQYSSEKEELKDIRNYLFQLYTELNYRLENLDERIKELENHD
jgi:hypothetical protein